MTYHMLGEKVANLMKQPFSLELQNRIIHSYKTLFATRIRQTFERNSIDNSLKLSYVAELEEATLPFNSKIKCLKTKNKVPKPIRFINDAPYTFVGNGIYSYLYATPDRLRSNRFLFPNGYFGYILNDNYMYIYSTISDNNIKLDKIRIESIFFSPEEVLTMNDDTNDGLDIELPFPEDMINSVTTELLKTEFGINNPDDNLTVKLNENSGNVSE